MNLASPRAWVALIAIACLHCETQKTAPATHTDDLVGAGDAAVSEESPADAGTSPEPPVPTKDAGPDEWYACQKPEDCTLVPDGYCCAKCDPVGFIGITAVHKKHKADFMAHQGCSRATCPPCSPLPRDTPNPSSNFFTLCQAGRCKAMDLRLSPYSACKTTADCALRFGIGCCEGCGDGDLVTSNRTSSLQTDICPTKHKCPAATPACLGYRSPTRTAECVLDHCQLTDN